MRRRESRVPSPESRWGRSKAAAIVCAALVSTVVLRVEARETVGVDSARVDSAESGRSPTGAMLRSLALPGWGQFYNGKYIKGSLFAVAEIGSVVAFFVRRNQIEDETLPGMRKERNVYFFTTIGAILFSLGDAYVDAHLD